jgi:Spy/CpxP family protein refolding chaperone
LQDRYRSALVAIALFAGLAIGFAGSTMAYRYGILGIPGERPIHRMNRLLHLTPSQREQVGEVMEETHAKIQELRRNFRNQRRRDFADAYIRIHALLTPEQQSKFDQEFVPPRFRAEAQRMASQSAEAPSRQQPNPGPSATP